jgi:hypothetical protein
MVNVLLESNPILTMLVAEWIAFLECDAAECAVKVLSFKSFLLDDSASMWSL